MSVRVSPLRSSANRARNTSGSKAGLTPLGLAALHVAAHLGQPR